MAGQTPKYKVGISSVAPDTDNHAQDGLLTCLFTLLNCLQFDSVLFPINVTGIRLVSKF
jgi:hypothetical protein